MLLRYPQYIIKTRIFNHFNNQRRINMQDKQQPESTRLQQFKNKLTEELANLLCGDTDPARTITASLFLSKIQSNPSHWEKVFNFMQPNAFSMWIANPSNFAIYVQQGDTPASNADQRLFANKAQLSDSVAPDKLQDNGIDKK